MRLEQAMVAYRSALEVRTRERMPLDWAGTQYNLANALQTLGDQENAREYLEQTLVAYQAALEVFAAAKSSHHCEMVQKSLARTVWILRERHT